MPLDKVRAAGIKARLPVFVSGFTSMQEAGIEAEHRGRI
jgi:hypothetical protein